MAFRRSMLLVLLLCGAVRADEVLPSLSSEKMSEYKNAFGKAVSESQGALGKSSPPDGHHRGQSALGNLSKEMRDGNDNKGPSDGNTRFDKGPRGDGPPKDWLNGGHDGMRPPPGFGGPGQPGGPGGPGGGGPGGHPKGP